MDPDRGPSDPAGDVVDWTEALQAVQGNPQLLRIVVEAAIEELPRLLETLRQAADEGDATRLRLTAHTLKGSLRYFGNTGSFEHACALEKMGQEHNLAGVAERLAALEEAATRIIASLAGYLN
jgi:HPt (histidine-containing phosphotransfer) domain-containing protein